MVDIGIWASGAELRDEQVAGAVAQRLGGVARSLVRQIPPDRLRYGAVEQDDKGQQVQTSGLQLLMRGLGRRYGSMDVETSIQAVIELLCSGTRKGCKGKETKTTNEIVRQTVSGAVALAPGTMPRDRAQQKCFSV